MKLSTLLRALGLVELARRVGVSPATIKRWQRSGVSASGQEALNRVGQRRRAAAKGAKTRRARVEFHERLPVPVEPFLDPHRPIEGEFDDPADLVPDRPPVETQAQLRRLAAAEGVTLNERIRGESYEGDAKWHHVGTPLVQLDVDTLVDDVIKSWQESGREWGHVLFLMFRYIPANPLYRGEMLKKAEKWHPFWVSTEMNRSMNQFANGIRKTLEEAYESARSRLIWMEGYRLRTLDVDMLSDNKPDWLNRRLREF